MFLKMCPARYFPISHKKFYNTVLQTFIRLSIIVMNEKTNTTDLCIVVMLTAKYNKFPHDSFLITGNSTSGLPTPIMANAF